MIKLIELNHLSCLYLVKVVLFQNHELDYQYNTNVDQSIRAIPMICTRKKCNMDFLDSAHEMPTLILCVLFHHDRGWKNESSLGRIGEYIFCQYWVKGHHTKKIYNFLLFTCTDCRSSG